MEDSEQIIEKCTNKENRKIIFQWIGMNLAGWILAMALGYCYGEYNLGPRITLSMVKNRVLFELFYQLEGIFVWFPFGFWLGLLQALYLRKWHVPFFRWILVTMIGFGLPLSISRFIGEQEYFRMRGGLSLELLLVGVIITILFLSWSQYRVLQELFEKSKSWMIYSFFGYLSWVIVYTGAMFLLIILIPETPDFTGRMYDEFMVYFTSAITPIFSIVPSIITGLFLAKNRKVELENDHTI